MTLEICVFSTNSPLFGAQFYREFIGLFKVGCHLIFISDGPFKSKKIFVLQVVWFSLRICLCFVWSNHNTAVFRVCVE